MENAGFEKSKYYKKEEIEMEPIKLQNQQDDKGRSQNKTRKTERDLYRL